MKFLRASLLALLLGSSSASAASGYFGVRLDGSTVFENTGQTTITTVIPMIGIQAGIDFDSPSSGFGLRFALSTQVVSGGRGAIDGYFRFPIRPELSSYVGAGATVLVASNPFFFVGVHALAGLEYQGSPSIALFAEISPGTAFGAGTASCLGPPLPGDGGCYSLEPFTLEAAIGLNFRF
jgi:hypothetical protein